MNTTMLQLTLVMDKVYRGLMSAPGTYPENRVEIFQALTATLEWMTGAGVSEPVVMLEAEGKIVVFLSKRFSLAPADAREEQMCRWHLAKLTAGLEVQEGWA